MDIFLSPHNDDEVLFGCYTLIRKKPLVIICTDSYIEEARGDGVTAGQRIWETKEACKLLGVKVKFLHIPDNEITETILHKVLEDMWCDTCYAPAFEEGGNPIHNLVARVAPCFFDCIHYTTYTAYDTKTKGSQIVIPTEEEKELKRKALLCYPSQMKIKTTAPFFNNPDVLNYESYQ